MNPARILAVVLALGAVGAGGYVLLADGNEAPPPRLSATASTATDAEHPDAAQGDSADSEALQRTAYEGGEELNLPPVEHAALAVTGRVVDPMGNPIGGAKVRVEYRQGFGNGFPGRGNRGNRGGGPDNGAAFGGRGRRGQELTPAQQAQFEAMRSRFRPQPVGDAVVTGGDGRYKLSGDAYSNSSLTISVTHDAYAPVIERREWETAMGELKVADIVMHLGVIVTGTVVDDSEHPVPGAEVSFASAADDGNNPFGPPGGNRGGRGNRGNGRGGRGGFGPGGFGNGIADLVGIARTDATGGFRLGPIPAEAFELVATAEHFLDGHSRRIEAAEGQQLPAQRVMVVAAAGMRGVVHDSAGQPIANARITGEVSREAMMAEFRAQRDAAAAQAPPAATPNGQDQQGRRGRRGQGGPGGNAEFARMREVMSATETVRSNQLGEFEFTKLPRAQVKLTAEHPRFLTTTQEPIDAQRSPNVVLVMPDALSVSGTVVDAATGAPVENFGIAARRTGGDNGDNQDQGGFGNRRGGRGNRGGNPPQQEDAAAVAQQSARSKWLQDVLGPAGRMPGRTPPASKHPAGGFTVDGLQPGEIGFDIDAPGYVRAATPAIKVEGRVEGLVLRVERGAVLQGRVELQNHAPVVGAAVELLLPEAPADIGPVDVGGRGGPGGFGGFGGRSGMRLARAETDADGRYTLPPVRPGTYRLRADKDGLMDFEEASIVLASAKTVEHDIVMTAGGTVTGVVRNLEPGVNVRVTLTHATDRSRHSASVDAASGQYKIEGLPAGSYFASLNQFGADQQAMRAMIANAMAQREKQVPDLTVAAGATVQFDFVAGQDPLGVVVGSVFFNNQPGTGMQVRLNRIGDAAGSPAAPSPDNPGNRGGGGNRFQQMADQLLRATVAADGSFVLPTVPPGSYLLEVQRQGNGGGPGGGRGGFGGRGGRGGSPTLFKQNVEVVAFGTQRVQVDLHTSEVEFKVALPEAVAANPRVRVSVALSSEAANLEPQQWRRLDSYQALGLRNGTTGPQQLPPGLYRYQLAGRGIEPVVGDLVVSAGQPQVVSLSAVAAPEPAPGAVPDPTNPGNPQGQGGRGGRNRGQGGQGATPGQGGGQPGQGRQGGGRQRGGRQGQGGGAQPGGTRGGI